MRSHRLLAAWVAVVLVAGLASTPAVGTSDDAALVPARTPVTSASTSTSSTTSAPTTTTTRPRVLFSFTDVEAGTTSAFEVDLAGAVTEVIGPDVPVSQVSAARDLVVYSKILDSTSDRYEGCGVGGCSAGFRTTTEAGIAFARLDGSDERVVTIGGYDSEPSFSPDGAYVAYLSLVALEGGSTTTIVRVMDTAGRPVTEMIPPDGTSYASPAWRPDGTAIAVVRSRQHELPRSPVVAVLPLDGGPATDLAGGNFSSVAWSPDGSRLVAVATHYDNDPPYPPPHPGEPTGTDLWLVPADGSPAQQLTHFAPPALKQGVFCGAGGGVSVATVSPAWSPDGTRIAFLSNEAHWAELGRAFDLLVIDSDGQNLRTLHAGPKAVCDEERGHAVVPRKLSLLGWVER